MKNNRFYLESYIGLKKIGHLFLATLLVFTMESCSQLTKMGRQSDEEAFFAGLNRQSEISTENMDKLISGWAEMMESIDRFNPQDKNLNGQSFPLKINLAGDWNLHIHPKKAFQVKKEKAGAFVATVKNFKLLYDQSSGLVKRALIQAEIRKTGGNRGQIDLSPHVGHQYQLTYYQKNGRPIDFSEISKGHSYELMTSNAQKISSHAKQKNALIVTLDESHRGPMGEEIQISLKLTDRKSQETYLTPPISLPLCQAPEADKITHQRTPGQCVFHLTEGQKWEQSQGLDLSLEETFSNTCHRKIHCKVISRFGLVKGGKIVFVKKQSHEIELPPTGQVTLKTNFNFQGTPHAKDFEAKIYSISRYDRSILSADSSLKGPKDFMECRW